MGQSAGTCAGLGWSFVFNSKRINFAYLYSFNSKSLPEKVKRKGREWSCEHKGLKSELQMAPFLCIPFPSPVLLLRSAYLTILWSRHARLNQFRFELESSFTRRGCGTNNRMNLSALVIDSIYAFIRANVNGYS